MDRQPTNSATDHELTEEQLDSVSGGSLGVGAMRQKFGDALADLESQDKLGNFEIQNLMSRYNQSEQLASSVQKKDSDTDNAVIGKIG